MISFGLEVLNDNQFLKLTRPIHLKESIAFDVLRSISDHLRIQL